MKFKAIELNERSNIEVIKQCGLELLNEGLVGIVLSSLVSNANIIFLLVCQLTRQLRFRIPLISL